MLHIDSRAFGGNRQEGSRVKHHSVANQVIVATEHIPLVSSALEAHGVTLSCVDDFARLDLTLAEFPAGTDLEAAASRLCQSVPPDRRTPSSPHSQPLDPLLSCLRDWFATKYSGWTPAIDKTPLLHLAGAPFHFGLHFVDPPEPVATPTAVTPGRPRWPELAGPPLRRVRVGLVDTGLAPHPRLEGAYFVDPHGLDVMRAGESRRWWRGHATFVANIILEHAPSAELHVAPVVDALDGDLEVQPRMSAWTFAQRLGELQDAGVQVVNCAVGCATGDGKPPLILERAITRLASDMIVVAAAGNHGSSAQTYQQSRDDDSVPQPGAPFYPAALDGVLAVGALTTRGEVAHFNPRGVGGTDWAPWIDLFAPGTDIVSAYLGAASDEQVVVPRRDQPSDEVRIFSGWAKWSGTSFAAARVTGAIASQIAFRTGADEVLPAVRTLFPSPAIA
jgi:hypothetical protein